MGRSVFRLVAEKREIMLFRWLQQKLSGSTEAPKIKRYALSIFELIDNAEAAHGADVVEIAMARTTEIRFRRELAHKLGTDIRGVPDYRSGGSYNGMRIVMDDSIPESEIVFRDVNGKALSL